MTQNNNENISNLLKKWELLWNQYKLQNESLEKRRNFFWVIQGALFVAWYHVRIISCLSILIIPFGFFISLIWIIIIKRDSKSMFLTEESLRDVECQLNWLSESFYLDRFNIDKICLSENKSYKWKFTEN